MEKQAKYPIGQQDFASLREGDCVYVDKTAYIEKIIHDGSRYFFLARPRRFGKSLFLSVLRYFFEGRRDLFEGLYIDSVDWDWEEYPVLRLDFNTQRYEEQGQLDATVSNYFSEWEEKYGIANHEENLSVRFGNLIRAAHEKTGHQVVILVDEYDKPLVGNLSNDDNFEHYRAKLASLYSNFKSSAEHIRLVFLTGVSRFSKLSVFSDLNNIKDVTFSNEYADICGITENELLGNFQQGIAKLAEERPTSVGEICRLMKKNYDGYRFAPKGSDIYNPWSVLNAMADSSIRNFWNNTGAPTIIAEALHTTDADIEKITNSRWDVRRLAGLDLRNADPTALLYQTGYLTIKNYDFETDTVTLKVPNDEVKYGLFNELLPYYVKTRRNTPEGVVFDIIFAFCDGLPEEAMKNLDAYFAGIPYDMRMDNENNFHNAVYILLSLIGLKTQTEVHTSDGRIDLLVETPKFVYIIELKYDSTAQDALRQIEKKQYARRFATDPRRLFRIGVSFSSATRRIQSWLID